MKKRDSAPAGWYHDPAFRFNQRFWDGETWTDRVASGTTELNDPLGVKKISVHYSPAGVFSETPAGWGQPDASVPLVDSVPTCSKCGGTQFQTQRSAGTKLAFGFASLIGAPRFVSCVVCGQRYSRPNV